MAEVLLNGALIDLGGRSRSGAERMAPELSVRSHAPRPPPTRRRGRGPEDDLCRKTEAGQIRPRAIGCRRLVRGLTMSTSGSARGASQARSEWLANFASLSPSDRPPTTRLVAGRSRSPTYGAEQFHESITSSSKHSKSLALRVARGRLSATAAAAIRPSAEHSPRPRRFASPIKPARQRATGSSTRRSLCSKRIGKCESFSFPSLIHRRDGCLLNLLPRT